MKKDLIPTAIASAILTVALPGVAAAAPMNNSYHGQPQSFANDMTPASKQPGNFPSKVAPGGTQPSSFANNSSPAGKQPGDFATNTHEQTVLNANRLIGQPVVNEQDRNVGRLKTLMLNRSSGSVRYGVVSENGASYVVPWKRMKETSTGQIKVDVTGNRLQSDFSAFEPVSMHSNSASRNKAQKHPFLNNKITFFNDNID